MSIGHYCVYLSDKEQSSIKDFIYKSGALSKTLLDDMFEALPDNYIETVISVLLTEYGREFNINNSADRGILKDYFRNRYKEFKESKDSEVDYYTTGEEVSQEEYDTLKQLLVGILKRYLGEVNRNLTYFRKDVLEQAKRQGVELLERQDSDFYTFITSLSDSIIDKLEKQGKTVLIKPSEELSTNMSVLVIGDTIILKYNPYLIVRDANKFDEIIAHELTHVVTVAAPNRVKKGIASLEEKDFTNAVYDIIKDLYENHKVFYDMNIDAFSPNSKYKYIKEFIANVMSDKNLREKLDTILYKEKDSNISEEYKPSILKKFMNALTNYIKSFFKKEVDTTYLDKLVEIIQSHINNQESYEEESTEDSFDKGELEIKPFGGGKSGKQVVVNPLNFESEEVKNNPTKGYIFSENALMYTALFEGENYNKHFGKYLEKEKLKFNVKASLALIRFYDDNTRNENAFGIITKKVAQNKKGEFLRLEGCFNSTPEDEKLFEEINEKAIQRIADSKYKNFHFPQKIATEQAALPKKLAEWLALKLKEQFNINYVVEKVEIKNKKGEILYSGYGLVEENAKKFTESIVKTLAAKSLIKVDTEVNGTLLTISTNDSRDYSDRTEDNVINSDVTFLFAVDFDSAGERKTTNSAEKYNKPLIKIDLTQLTTSQKIVSSIIEQLEEKKLDTKKSLNINIAGNGIYLENIPELKTLDSLLTEVLKGLKLEGVNIKSIRSGGLTGVDEAGIKAALNNKIPTTIHTTSEFTYREESGKNTDIKNDPESFLQRFNISEEALNRVKESISDLLFKKGKYVWSNNTKNLSKDSIYEVSTAAKEMDITQGDARFSALNAKFKDGTKIDDKDVSGWSIEDVYLKVIKKSGKGQPPSKESKVFNDKLKRKTAKENYTYNNGYLPLWKVWAELNPKLIKELAENAEGKILVDSFANTLVSQARALADILNEYTENLKEKNKKEKLTKEKLKLKALESYHTPRPEVFSVDIDVSLLDSILFNEIPDIVLRRELITFVYLLFNHYWDIILQSIKYQYNNPENLSPEQIEFYQEILKGTEAELKLKIMNLLTHYTNINGKDEYLDTLTYITSSMSKYINRINKVGSFVKNDNTGEVEFLINEEMMLLVIKIFYVRLDDNGDIALDNNNAPIFVTNNPLGKAFYERYGANKEYLKKDLMALIRNLIITSAKTLAPLKNKKVFDATLLLSLRLFKHYDNIKIYLNGSYENKEDTDNVVDAEQDNLATGLNLIKFKTIEPSKRMSARVRSMLSKLPRYRDNKIVYNSLGLPELLSPDHAYYTLLEKFAKIKNEQEFDKLVEELHLELPWFKSLLDLINSDEIFKNDFYTAFRNAFNLYATVTKEGKISYLNGEVKISTILKDVQNNYESGILLTKYSIYNSNGTLNVRNIENLKNGVLNNFSSNLNIVQGKTLNKAKNELLATTIRLLLILSNEGIFNSTYNLETFLGNFGIDSTKLDLSYLHTTVEELLNYITLKLKQQSQNPEDVKDFDFKKEIFNNEGLGENGDIKTLLNTLIEYLDENEEIAEILKEYFKEENVQKKHSSLETVISSLMSTLNQNSIKQGTNFINRSYKHYLSALGPLKDSTELYSTSSFLFEGDTRPSYSTPSYTSDILKMITSIDTEEDIVNFKNWVYNNFTKYDFYRGRDGKVNHLWLRKILDFIDSNTLEDEDKHDLEAIKRYVRNFTTVEILKMHSSKRGNKGTIGKIDTESFIGGIVKSCFNSTYNDGLDNSFGYFRNILYSDKDVLTLFQVPMFTNDKTYKKLVINLLYEVWRAEYSRKKFYERRKKLGSKENGIDGLEKTGDKFHFFVEFNNLDLFDLVIPENATEKDYEDNVKQAIEENLEDEFQKFFQGLSDTIITDIINQANKKGSLEEMFNDNTEEEPDEDGLNLAEENDAKDSDDEEVLEESSKQPVEKSEREIAEKILRKFFYNDFMNYIENVRLFLGDPALYGNFTALVKRGALSHVFGKRGYFIDENGNDIVEKCAYIKDFYIDSMNMYGLLSLLDQDADVFSKLQKAEIAGLLVKTGSLYLNICTTDGLSLRTINSIKVILKGFGELTPQIEESLNRILNGTATAADIFRVIEVLKPFLFSHEERVLDVPNSDEVRTEKVVTLHKNSEYAISALYSILNTVLQKNETLKGMQLFMEDNDIDVIHFESVVKVGGNNYLNLNDTYKDEELLYQLIDGNNWELTKDGATLSLKAGEETLSIDVDKEFYKSVFVYYDSNKEKNIEDWEPIPNFAELLHDFLRVTPEKYVYEKENNENEYKSYLKGLLLRYILFMRNYSLEALSAQEVTDILNRLLRTDSNGKEQSYVNQDKIHTFPLKDYVIVQPVLDHYVDHEAIFGSLLRNIIPGNLPENFTCTLNIHGKQVTLNKKQAFDLYETLISDNLLDSYLEVLDKIGNIDNLSKHALDMVNTNDLYSKDIAAALTLNDTKTGFRVPLSSPNLSNKIDELILGPAKKIIQRLLINGGNAVLVSNFGFTTSLKTETKIVNGKETLRSIPCYAPMSFMSAYKDYLIENEDGFYYIDFDKMKKDNIDSSFLKMIGYRIPTESNYSIFSIKIVGILPLSMGSTIILPLDIITKSGTDFK